MSGFREGFSNFSAALAAKLTSAYGVQPGAGVPIALVTSSLNLASTSLNNPFLGGDGNPFSAAGKVFLLDRARWLFSDLNGSITSVAKFNAGANVAKTNVFVSPTDAATAGNVNSLAGTPGHSTQAVPGALAPLCDISSPILLDVTVAAVLNTATLFHARLALLGWLL